MILTPTLQYWGFKEHPFADNILRGDLVGLFVDREIELARVEDCLGRSRVVGVHGKLGVGKSSFLHKLCENLVKAEVPVVYVHLNADSEQTLYRELLTELLVSMEIGALHTKNMPGFKPQEEAQRLHASVASSRGADYGAKLAGLGGNFVENRTASYPMHTEATARESIRRIFDGIKTHTVIIFDDFEKLRYETSGKTRDYFPILSRFVSTIEELLNRQNITFVISMDDQVERLIEAEHKKGGKFAFSLNSLCQIPTLSLDHLWEMVATRLKHYGWKGKPADFMDDDAFYALAVASANHPRKAVHILAEAMLCAASSKGGKRQLGADAILKGAAQARMPVDKRDWLAIQYLLKHGESSNSDDAMREHLGYQRKTNTAYHTSVDRKLNAIASALRLDFEKTSTGKTVKKLLRLPKVDRS